jgi:predicted phosphate transport protein (TIGR00153 family)
MLKRFLPQEEGFFELFQKVADILVLTATQFHCLLLDLHNQQKYVDAIAAYEDEGDKIAHTTFDLLHKTFITPFDRHDIHRLTSKLDDVLDLINRCAQRFPFYHLQDAPEEMTALADITVQCTKAVKKAVYRLNSLSKSAEILSFCEELNKLESQAHVYVLAGEKVLFLEENDFKHFFKLKEIYSRTKDVINNCQDVANIIKGIVLEYS